MRTFSYYQNLNFLDFSINRSSRSMSASDNLGVFNDLLRSASLSKFTADCPVKIGDDFINTAITFGF